MNKDAYGTASFGGDVEPILPDGWEEGMDIFADSEVKDDLSLADEQETDLLAELTNEKGDSEDPAPTTGTDSDEPEPSAGTDTTGSPDGDDPAAGSVSRIRKLKVNHEEREIDLSTLSDDDLIAHLQKSYAFDAMREKENQQLYRKVYNEQLDAGMTEYVAELVARDVVGKTYSLTGDEETPVEASPASPAPAAPAAPAAEAQKAPAARDFAYEIEQLKALYPDIKTIPDEVAKAASKGIPVLTAFLAYRDKQSEQTAAALRAENNVLKQNAASAAKAPVRGVTGGGTPSSAKKPSIFESAFDDGLSWR